MTSRGVDQELPGGASSFVRALWGLDVSVRALPESPSELAPRRPRFIGSRIWLPAPPLVGVPGSVSNYLLAAASHASAHQRFGAGRFQVKALKPVQIAIISLLEDARVEQLAVARYPGLTRLWGPFHVTPAGGAKTSGALLARLARALQDEAYVDDDAWVSKAQTLFFEARASFLDPDFSRRVGGALGNDLGQMRVQFNAREYLVQPPYRDDNVGLWQFAQESAPDGSELESEGARRVAASERPRDQQQDGRPPAAVSASERPTREAARGIRPGTTTAPESAFRYAEWDYVIARERPEFCTVREKTPQAGELSGLEAALGRYGAVRRRLGRSVLRLASQRLTRLRRLTAGDRLDLPAAIAAVVARASAGYPDPRVYRQVRFVPEPPVLLLLIDLSESLNDKPSGASTTLLELARNASGLIASTLSAATRDLAIHGFSSNGRHDVGYYRFKDFDQPYDHRAGARLAGMRASLSTRLGAALRHAGRALAVRAARRNLLFVVTDGEPSDVDVHDSKYLMFDAKQATLGNRQLGVRTVCICLDASAEASVKRIFGQGNYLLLDRLDALPEKLSQLYLRLAM
ncbi:MAG TPA: hypothetical protein VGF76_25260 [Polyangiaceae bacterium]|jgi:hypothetical protein